ncbi:MAG: HAD family hydrolase [Deltaproteobacteria bacterium]|nr:HAD family hydrolase [Deltaproteobacteria bacterium]
MIYSSIIFDLDGTLLDTLTDIVESVNSVLTEHQFPIHTRKTYKTFLGDGHHNLITRSVPESTSEPVILKCCDSFTDIYAKTWMKNCCPYAGVNTMLNSFSDQQIKLAVLSNKPHAFTRKFVERFLPGKIFSAVFGQRDEVEKKPHPAGALAIAAILGQAPAEILFVGDSDIDIKTGKAAGMGTVGVSWGYRPVKELIENRADIIVNSPLEIVEYVLSAT